MKTRRRRRKERRGKEGEKEEKKMEDRQGRVSSDSDLSSQHWERLKQEDPEFEASLGSTVKHNFRERG